MRALHKSSVITPAEPIEVLAIDYWQDKGNDPDLCKSIQVIPIVAIKIETYKQTYRDSDTVDYMTETKYKSTEGEIDLDEFAMIQPVRSDNTLACLSVIALRAKGSNQVCVLEPSSGKNWLNYSSLFIDPNLYTTHSSGESHPVSVELDQLLKDIESTFPAITEFNTGDQGASS